MSSGLVIHSDSNAKTATAERSQNYLKIATGYEYSDNLLKRPDNPISGYLINSDIVVGYIKKTPLKDININYKAYYAKHSEDLIKIDKYWTGQANYKQNFFSKNFMLEIDHLRHRYLFNNNDVALPKNLTERDILTISPSWLIPYSARSKFKLTIGHIAVNYPEISSINSKQKFGEIGWIHALSPLTQIGFITEYTEAEINNYKISYGRWETGLMLRKQYRHGLYLIKAGQSDLTYQDAKYKGISYQATIDYLAGRHTLKLDLTRKLTDSSFGLGRSQNQAEPAYENGTVLKLLWRKRLELYYRYAFTGSVLNSVTTLYLDSESPLSLSDQTTSYQSLKYQGITTKLTWKLSEKLGLNFEVNYRSSELQNQSDFKRWLFGITGSYRWNRHVDLLWSIKRFDETNNQRNFNYEEWRYLTGIVLKF